MRKVLGGGFILIVGLVLLAPLPVSAKGDFNYITVNGPGWYGDLVIVDEDDLHSLNPGLLEDFKSSAKISEPLGAGYLISRGYRENGKTRVYDRLMYFPSPTGGEGLVYYLETVDGSGPYDGRWFHTTMEGNATMLRILGEHSNGVSDLNLTEAGTEAATFPFWPFAVVGALAGGWLVGYRWERIRSGKTMDPLR